MMRLGRYNDAIKIFDGLIQEELSRENGPTDTLVYSYKSKYQTLQKDKQTEKARLVRKEAADELKRWPYLANKAYEFYELEWIN